MAQQAVLVGSVVLAGALLGASAPWSRVLPACSEVPAAEREAARLAGRCEGAAPIVSADPRKTQGKAVREATLPRRAVPELRGRPFNSRDERLAYYVVNVAYRESALRRDWVIDQEPRPPATLPQGGNLRVVLSDGALVRVPDVRGSFARALVLLYRAGLGWSAAEGATGPVIGQQPTPGAAVRPGTQIVLRHAPGPVALAPESTRPAVAPAPAPRGPTTPAPPTTPTAPAATTPTAPPAGSTLPPAPATAPATIAMPDVQGMMFDAARERLPGLSVQRVHRAGTEPGGTVIGQTPAAGAPVAPGAAVRLVLSDGTLVRVPRVMSFTISEARQRLAAGELRPVVTNVASDSPAGTVTGQQPAEGAIAQRGSTIRLNVSSGPATAPAPAAPATVAVPNVVGSTVERSRRVLERFTVERSERSAREPVGTILEQSPAPGTRVTPGSALSVIVSTGGRPETIEVANVVGQGAEAATSALSEFRLESESVPSVEPAGRVLSQDPPAGAAAAPGSTVRLRVSDGSRVVAPSFARMTLGQARDAARAAGLTLALSAGTDDPAALVQRQEPAPGTEVARGSALQVAVEERALPFSVPSGVRDAWARASTFLMQQSTRTLAMALVVLLALLALLLMARRRGRTRYATVEPVFGPTRQPPVAPASRVKATAPAVMAPTPVTAPAPLPPKKSAPARRPPPEFIPASVAAPVAGPVPTPEGPTEPAGPAVFARRSPAPAPVAAAPEPEPIAVGATARLDVDANATRATNAMPRGPEIRIAARLDAGEGGYRELPAEKTTDELTEETK